MGTDRESGAVSAFGSQDKDVGLWFAGHCQDIYGQALARETLGSLQVIQNMEDCLAEEGYPVIDQCNQIDMQNQDLMEDFCKRVKRKQNAEQMLAVVMNNVGLQTRSGGPASPRRAVPLCLESYH